MSRVRSFALGVAVVSLALAGSACGDDVAPPRSQWLIRVQTDAPIPQFGDRILVELVDERGELACSECRRIFGIRGADQLPLSFGIADLGRTGLRLRVRMFRADHSTAGGQPRDGLPLDFLGSMPATGGAVRRLRVDLRLSCAGIVADLQGSTACAIDGERASIGIIADDDDRLLPATPLIAFDPCGDVPDGMVCVPGTVFALGQSQETLDDDPRRASVPERLTRVTTFAMDKTEMTVGGMRALVNAGKVLAPRTREVVPSCTYTERPGAYEQFPVNCVSWEEAATACAALGKRLPTEAEWELAAGNGADESTYPWGESDDICSQAIIGRGRNFFEGSERDVSTICRNPGDGSPPLPWGPVAVGEGADVTKLGIRHLGGNVSEWTSDYAHGYSECFGSESVLVNPSCRTLRPGTPEGEVTVYRGSNWQERGYNANVTVRSFSPVDGVPHVGFRCVRGGGP